MDYVYYFDINESFVILYKELNIFSDAMVLVHDFVLGARVEDVLLCAMERDLLAMIICIDPRKRNQVVHFDNVVQYTNI